MQRRAWLKTALGAVISGAPAILRGSGRAPVDKPNLLFLWTDEQRADTFAVYGNRTYRVPALNRLAAASVSFERCYVTQPICAPNRASVLTGLWPHVSGVTANNISLPDQTPTFPQLLSDSSYQTAYMGKWHLGDEIFPQHGFQDWVSIEDAYHRYYSPDRDPEARSSYHDFLVNHGYQPDPVSRRFSRDFAARLPAEHCKATFLANCASRFILRNRHQPWILYLNFLEPHMPFTGPFNDLHSGREAPVPDNYPGLPVEKEPELYHHFRRSLLRKGFGGQDLTTRAGWQRLNRNYAGLCSLVDRAVGRILWTLEASGQTRNTIVVYTSDHGEMMGSHSLLGKQVLYEESIRVPLLIRVPFRQNRPAIIKQPVSHIDLVPTLLELMTSKSGPSLPGQSLVPLLRAEPIPQDHVFIEWHAAAAVVEAVVKRLSSGPNARAVISSAGWKLGIYDTDNDLLFHRKRDPLEIQNLRYRGGARAIMTPLLKKLEAWQRETRDEMALPPMG